MERYERKFWDLTSALADAEARMDDLYNAMGVAEFNRLFPENKPMAEEWSVIAKQYHDGVVPNEIRAQFEEKHADHLTRVREFYSEKDELYELIPMLRRREAEREEQEEKAKKEEWKREAYHGFLSKSTMMAAARKAQVLDKRINFADNGIMTWAAFAEYHLTKGDLSPQKDEYTKEVEKGPWYAKSYSKKQCTEYYINNYAAPKTAYDYAVYLSNLKK